MVFINGMLIPSICIQTNDIIAKTLPLLVNKAIISIDIKSKKINYLLRSLTFLKILTGKLPQIKENRRFCKINNFLNLHCEIWIFICYSIISTNLN